MVLANWTHAVFDPQPKPQVVSPAKEPREVPVEQVPPAAWWLTSHPFDWFPSQFENPLLQAARAQLPVAHDALAFGTLHGTPHAPQLVRVVRLVSQPFVALPSQLPQPDEQFGAHVAETHAVVPCAFVQTVPQAPQLLPSLERFLQTFEQQAPLAHWAFAVQAEPSATRHCPPEQAYPGAQ